MSAVIHIRNLFINWGATVANLLVAFFLAPYVIGELGLAAYGVWSLLNVVAGYMGILDLGIGASTGRHICLYLGKKNYDAVDDTIRTSLALFSALGLAILFVGVVVGINFLRIFPSVPFELAPIVRWLMPLMALNILFTACAAVYRSVLTAHGRFDIARGIDVFVLLVRTVVTVLVLSAGKGLVGLALAVILSNFLALVLACLAAKYIYRPLPIYSLKISRIRLKEMMNFGLAAFLCSVTVQIVGQTDLLLSGWIVDVNAVTIYSVGAALIWYAAPFVGMINATLFPAIQQAVGAGKIGDAIWLMFRQARLTLLIAIPMNVGFAVFSESFLNLWMGSIIGEDGVKVGALVMSVLAVNRLQISMTTSYPNLLSSLGKIWKITYVNVAESVLNIGFSLLLALGFDLGLFGIALGSLLARAVTVTLGAPILLKMEAGVGLAEQAREIFFPGLWTSLVFASVCVFVQKAILPDNWTLFALAVTLSLLIYSGIAWCFLVPKDIKDKLYQRFVCHHQ